MWSRLRFIIKRTRERLWVKPLMLCVLSIGAVFFAKLSDMAEFGHLLPEITRDSNETFLKIIAASMLVMATFAVASMVAAYASASSSATPRAFQLIIADDVSQNALSAFVGAFIYSVVALVALMNGVYGKTGQFTLFVLTMLVFATVILTFVRWVDNIARLGRLENTIDRVEEAAADAMRERLAMPRLGGTTFADCHVGGRPVYGKVVGYLQRVDMAALQSRAEASQLRVNVQALPGTFCTPDQPIARVTADEPGRVSGDDVDSVADAFTIGDARVFDQDPRFGLVVLSEVASRALSPAINDPGTAIVVIGTLVRLFVMWDTAEKKTESPTVHFDRIAVPELCMADLFDDAFTGIARDGAGTVEVVVRLQKALRSLSMVGNVTMSENALKHSRLSLARAEQAMKIDRDLRVVREAAEYSKS